MNRKNFTTLVGLCLCAVGTSSSHATLFYSQDSNASGLYVLDTSTGAPSLVGTTTVSSETVGLSPSATEGQLWGSKPFALLSISADGSGATSTGSSGIEGLALDTSTGILYYSINGAFGTVNTTTGALSPLARPGGDVEGLAYNDGLIYGLADGGNLSSYDISTNVWSLIGSTGVNFDQIGLAYDTNLDILYAIGDQDSFLYSVNPATAAATRIGDTGFNDAGGGLAFVNAVPVPATIALIGLGVAGIGYQKRKQIKAV